MSDSLVQRKFLRAITIVTALLILTITGCDGGELTETSMFEAAEVDYRLGNYDDALSGYQAFLTRYPTSPLAVTAEMRLRNIHREVASMMERAGTPRPVYHGYEPDQSAREAPKADRFDLGQSGP